MPVDDRGQFENVLRLAQFRRQSRRADGKNELRQQQVRIHTLPFSCPDTNADIHAIGNEIRQSGGRIDAQADLGMQCREPVEPVNKETGCEDRRHGDRQ
ncbi:hypothetical protein D3C87_1511820 [compost metagenome]